MKQKELIKRMLDGYDFQNVIAHTLEKVADKEVILNPYKEIMESVGTWRETGYPNTKGLVDLTKDKTGTYGCDMIEAGFKAGIDFALILLGTEAVYDILPEDMLEYDL